MNINNNEIKNDEIYLENINNIQITKDNIHFYLNNFCFISENNNIKINYRFFKLLNKFLSSEYLLNYIINIIQSVLNHNNLFNIHANIKSLNLVDIDKHKLFIQHMASILKDKFPDKLDFCYIYEAPFVFAQLYNLLSIFIDKKTQKKIKLVN